MGFHKFSFEKNGNKNNGNTIVSDFIESVFFVISEKNIICYWAIGKYITWVNSKPKQATTDKTWWFMKNSFFFGRNAFLKKLVCKWREQGRAKLEYSNDIVIGGIEAIC